MRIGILALQGAFAEHSAILRQLGADSFEIRQKRDLDQPMDGLIIPGGESTVMGKLLKELDCFDDIQTRIRNGLPVFGTCAGLILLAKEAEGGKVQLGTMDISARRNAYGRQLGSFSVTAEMKSVGEIPMVFIRAPYITAVSGNAEALAEVDGKIVAARQGNQLATAFHPELTDDTRVHQYFLEMISAAK
ncbi:pyridoxal 5'-phosphate synthase glutaminase subunit PdxT [Ruminococcus sp.]|uniref:pyridoxal 5'-phosphate synthase glutaminase subunit PdxT n=1 Tax=Ruminococcus sp. TaxID=41978 RepID=UPI0025F866BB|nr:pyridoxal 5'-phosphate synthase glutaminase subunit PdxT [Ruminococcus sp.]